MAAALAVWGVFAVTVVTTVSFTQFERNAIFFACGLAVLAAGVAVSLSRPNRPILTVFLASPFLVAAVSLPPVVTVLQWGTYPDVPISRVPSVVATIERAVLEPVGLRRTFANTVDREGFGYTLSWLLYSVPLGWLLASAILHVQFLRGENI